MHRWCSKGRRHPIHKLERVDIEKLDLEVVILEIVELMKIHHCFLRERNVEWTTVSWKR